MTEFIYEDTDSIKYIGWLVDSSGALTCYKCGCIVYPYDIEKGSCNYCPNCGRKNKKEKEPII